MWISISSRSHKLQTQTWIIHGSTQLLSEIQKSPSQEELTKTAVFCHWYKPLQCWDYYSRHIQTEEQTNTFIACLVVLPSELLLTFVFVRRHSRDAQELSRLPTNTSIRVIGNCIWAHPAPYPLLTSKTRASKAPKCICCCRGSYINQEKTIIGV